MFMEKIIVEIKCPALSDIFEFRISKKLAVNEGIRKIITEMRGYAQNEKLFSDISEVRLYSGRLKCVLNGSLTFSENNVHSGDTLMII